MAVIGNNNVISMWFSGTDYWANRSSNQWCEISTSYSITVNPKRTDSQIVFECSLPNQTVTHHGLNHYRIYNHIGYLLKIYIYPESFFYNKLPFFLVP